MRIPWDYNEHGNVCESGEIMIMTPLIRDYKKEKNVEAGGWKILGREKAIERRKIGKHKEIERNQGKFGA